MTLTVSYCVTILLISFIEGGIALQCWHTISLNTRVSLGRATSVPGT